MSDITLNTQSITGNHNFVPPGADWNLGSGSKKWNGGYFGTIIADAGIPAGTAATGGDKIGQIRFSINPNIEPGYLALNGQEVNREDYPNLWAWVQQQVGFLVEEGEWQSISSAHNGNVGKYSVGNGSTTFRLPNLGCWVRGGGASGNNGGNLDAGLPNITGSKLFAGVATNANGAYDGCIKTTATGSGYTWREGPYYGADWEIDASLSNSIYGASDTVQPESIVGIWLVKAYHVPVDNMGNTITVNGVSPDENGNIAVDALTNAIPVGTILPFAGNTIPEGFLDCNGAAVSRTTYSALYSAIGTIYGSGNGSTTFNLPNLTNKFLQGSNTAGTVKAAGLPNITGQTNPTWTNQTSLIGKGAFFIDTSLDNRVVDVFSKGNKAINFDASRSNSIYGASTTVQPPAVTVRYIIKY